MNSIEARIAVPIHVWIKAFFISQVFFWGGYSFFILRDRSINPSIFKEFSSTASTRHNGHGMDMYFLGSSMSEYALWKNQSFNRAMANTRDTINYKFVFLRLASINDLIGKTAEILETRPGYLFIESNMMSVDMSSEAIPPLSKFLLHYSLRLAKLPLYIFKHPVNILQLLSAEVPQEYREEFFKWDTNWEQYRTIAGSFKIRKLDEFEEWSSFFNEAKHLGIKIYLLDVPRSKQAELYLPDNYKKDLTRLADELKSNFGIGFIAFPERLDQKTFYIDAVHFNKIGAEVYSNWFVNMLQEHKFIFGN